jgi:predicted MFS family arabinose efflux permease
MNARLLGLAGGAGTEAVALNTSALYVGIAAAGAVGGATLEAGGVRAVLLTATVIGGAALLLLAGSVALHRPRPPRDDVAVVGDDPIGSDEEVRGADR